MCWDFTQQNYIEIRLNGKRSLSKFYENRDVDLCLEFTENVFKRQPVIYCEGFENAARNVRKQAFSRGHHKAQLEQGLPPTHSIEMKGKYLPIIYAKLTV